MTTYVFKQLILLREEATVTRLKPKVCSLERATLVVLAKS